jgi:hypothetical protein
MLDVPESRSKRSEVVSRRLGTDCDDWINPSHPKRREIEAFPTLKQTRSGGQQPLLPLTAVCSIGVSAATFHPRIVEPGLCCRGRRFVNPCHMSIVLHAEHENHVI